MKIRTSFNLTARRIGWGPYMVPIRYTVEADDDAWPFTVSLEVGVTARGFEAREVRFVARKDQSLQGTDLRVPVAALIRASAISVAMQEKQHGRWGPLQSDEEIEQFYARFRQQDRKGGRAPITDERLDEVAEVYRQNERTTAPSKAVATALDISPSYARALVARARKAGKLAPAGKGRDDR